MYSVSMLMHNFKAWLYSSDINLLNCWFIIALTSFVYIFSAFVGQATGKKGSSSLGTGKQTLRISSKGQAKVEMVSILSSQTPIQQNSEI